MPRKYVRKREKKYTEEDLKAAAKEVWAKRMNPTTAAKDFGVPRSTLDDYTTCTTDEQRSELVDPLFLPKQKKRS